MFLNNVSQVNTTSNPVKTTGQFFNSVKEAKKSIFEAEVKEKSTKWIREEITNTTSIIEEKKEQRILFLNKLAQIQSKNVKTVEPAKTKEAVKVVEKPDAEKIENSVPVQEVVVQNEPAETIKNTSKSSEGQELTLREAIDYLSIELEVAAFLVASLNRIYKSGMSVEF